MATYAQLQAEQWWGREVVTAEMDWLGDELCRRTNRPRSAAGTKGDNNHLRGAHRSQEWIKNSRYCTSRTYTVQDGLTSTQLRHIAGFDFTPGSDSAMVAQCKRIYTAVKGGRLEEVREFYGNVDGDKVVDGWDNVKNRAASSDSSHLWHWHLSIDRRHCANRKLMERIVAIALGDPVEDEMSAEAVVEGLRDPQPYQSTGVGREAARQGMGEVSERTLSEYTWADIQTLKTQQAALLAAFQQLTGRDLVDEPAIVAGILAGLGGMSLDDAVTALKAAFGDRTAELAAKLAQG